MIGRWWCVHDEVHTPVEHDTSVVGIGIAADSTRSYQFIKRHIYFNPVDAPLSHERDECGARLLQKEKLSGT